MHRSLIYLLTSTPALAVEHLTTDSLVVQEIPRGGDFMAFGFDSLWMMQTGKLLRINPTDNSVFEIKVAVALAATRGIAIGEDAVWIPGTGSRTIYKVDPISNSVVRRLGVANSMDVRIERKLPRVASGPRAGHRVPFYLRKDVV